MTLSAPSSLPPPLFAPGDARRRAESDGPLARGPEAQAVDLGSIAGPCRAWRTPSRPPPDGNEILARDKDRRSGIRPAGRRLI